MLGGYISTYVFDLEANGLLDTATNIWCGVFKDVSTGSEYIADGDSCYERLHEILHSCDTLIGHNICDYDLPLLHQILGYSSGHLDIFDTFLMSMLSRPDRKEHPNCPKGKDPHSLANFGAIFGRPKPEHEEWDAYSPAMLHRCREDVEITTLTWHYLCKEMGGNMMTERGLML